MNKRNKFQTLECVALGVCNTCKNRQLALFYIYKWMIAIGRLEKFARTLPTVNNISLQVVTLDELVIFIFTIFIIIQL